MVPTLADYSSPNHLPLDHVFSREQTFKNPKKIIKPEEDEDQHKNKGLFDAHKEFNLIILSDMSDPDCDDEIIQMVLDEIPNVNEFQKIYINPLN